jgi:hypothetical protein
MKAMRLLPVLVLPVLVLVTGCASATPAPPSPSASAASAAMRVRVDQAERDQALVDHWMARCGKRQEPQDPACSREHDAMFEALEMHGKSRGSNPSP